MRLWRITYRRPSFHHDKMTKSVKKKKSVHDAGIMTRTVNLWNYYNTGVWSDNRHKWWIKPLRTVNLSMRSFFNSDIQTQACAMTFRTLLAIVPALALIFAIGRGFGLQSFLQQELLQMFPGQQHAIGETLGFVDKYLEQSSEGVFVGIGLVFLLYTVINLLSCMEDTFNLIWGVKEGRSIWRKLSDYTAMLLILPVLMICGGGLSMILTSGIRTILDIAELSFLSEALIEAGSWVATCLFFMAVYMLIPNTKVPPKYALIAGVLAGTGFMVLQWLFVSGQLYVSRYNAIYGSFAFLPLLLIWMQFAWMVCLVGGVVCYSSQNVYSLSFLPDSTEISPSYRRKVVLAVVSIITRRFKEGKVPLTQNEIVKRYAIPPKLFSVTADRLIKADIIRLAVIDEKSEDMGYIPAKSLDTLTVSYVFSQLDNTGCHDLIPRFDKTFSKINSLVDDMQQSFEEKYKDMRVADIEFLEPPASHINANQH